MLSMVIPLSDCWSANVRVPVPPFLPMAVELSARLWVVRILEPAVKVSGAAITNVNTCVAVAPTVSVTVMVSTYDAAEIEDPTVIAPVEELIVTLEFP